VALFSGGIARVRPSLAVMTYSAAMRRINNHVVARAGDGRRLDIMRYSTTGQQLADSQHDLIDRFGLVNDGARAGGQSRGVQFPVPRFSQAGAEQLAGPNQIKVRAE